MSNNTPDYNDNLVFEPEMTWEELKDALIKVNINNESTNDDLIAIDLEDYRLYFHKDGSICAEFHIGKNNCGGLCLACDRTYEQMYLIITAFSKKQG